MRISTNYIYESTRQTLQRNISNLLKVQEVMATQRKVNRLSDDPIAVGRILNVDRMIGQNDQFQRNLGTASTITDLYDGALSSSIDVLTRAKELALAESNSATSTQATREAARVEILSLAGQLVSIANLQYGDRFLFGGFSDSAPPFLDASAEAIPGPGNTGTATITSQSIIRPAAVTGNAYEVRFQGGPPLAYDIVNITTGATLSAGSVYSSGNPIVFDGISLQISGNPADGDIFAVSTVPAGTYVGDQGTIRLEIDHNVLQQVNLTGDAVFRGAGSATGVDIFSLFQRMNTALQSNDQTQLSAILNELDAAAGQISRTQAEVGARQNLFAKSKERLQDLKMNMEVLLSDLRDVDLTEAITELNRQENAYQAVLAATSKILQPNLLDFLT